MAKKLGFVQTGGIGDLIIALPAAQYYVDRGLEVLWPVDRDYFPFIRSAAPTIRFFPVSANRSDGRTHLLDEPTQILRDNGCEDIRVLYSYVGKPMNERLFNCLKFDEYKYAIAGVPFREKWNLKLKRDSYRERTLFQKLGVTRDYVCVHRKGSNFEVDAQIPREWRESYQVVEVEEITDNPFDWLYALENASKVILVDSCFSNLVEQLNFRLEKHLILRSSGQFTPVFKNGWVFV